MGPEKKVELGYQVQELIHDVLKTDYGAEISFEGVKDALRSYTEKKTDSKFLVRPRRA